jgi:hypothetical protein
MIQLQPTRKRSVIVVAGISSYGKTTFAIRALLNLKLSARFLFDPDPGEFNPELGEFSDRLKLDPARSEYECALNLVRPGGYVAFDPHTYFPGDLENGCNAFCDWAYEVSLDLPGEKMIVIQDAYRFCSPHFIPEPMKKIVQSGSKRRLYMLVDAHEPQKLNSAFKAGMSEVVCFRLQGDGPLSFAEEFGFNRDEVANLDRLQFVARNLDSGGELRGRIPL